MRILVLPVFLLLFTGILKAQDRDLHYYLVKAKTNSPLINKNKNDNQLIGLDMEQVRALFSKPEINVDAQLLFAPIISHDNHTNRLEWAYEGATDYTGYDQAFSDGGQYMATVSIKQSLLNQSLLQATSRKADIDRQLNDNSIALTEHEIEQLVSHQYILCLRTKKQSEISLDLVNELKGQRATMQKLVEHAIYKQTDLMLLNIEYQNYELQHKTYLNEFLSDLYDLNLLCGIDDTIKVNLMDMDIKIKTDTILHSQFLRSYNLDSLCILSQQALFNQKYKPRLNVFADAGMNAVYLPGFNRFGFSTGLGLIWNIFDGNQRKIMQQKANVQFQTNAFNRQNFIARHTINKNKYLSRIVSVRKQMEVTQKQLSEYGDLLELYKRELSQQQISVMDFKNLFKDIASKKQENLLLNMELQALINAYNYWIY